VRLVSVPGDFDADSLLTVEDINELATAIRTSNHEPALDLTGDGRVDLADHAYWVHTVKHTSLGDANLDGRFESGDLVQVLQAGQYEDGVLGNSTWDTGDWDADGDFHTADLVVAFQDGGYEQGPRVGVAAVPEPTSLLLLIAAVGGLLRLRTVR
jgi:hypothetical protein